VQSCVRETGFDYAGEGGSLTKTHANHLSEKYLISLNHCAQLAVSTRVGGYMRGGGLERQKGKMAASSLKVVHGPVAVSPKGYSWYVPWPPP
jgi:hypothetical protein